MFNCNNNRMEFVCSRYSGVNEEEISENLKYARLYCKQLFDKGIIPICPHIYFPQFLNDNVPSERLSGMLYGLNLMNKCSAINVFIRDNIISKGMTMEILHAKSNHIQIKYWMVEKNNIVLISEKSLEDVEYGL